MMRQLNTQNVILILFLLVSKAVFAQNDPNKSLKEWQDAKFGMFVHWGLYSVAAGDWNGKPSRGNEHFMLYERVPLKEYAKLADRFNPVQFDADEWVKRAKDAGMKYVVFTSKHHDGYAMYDSKTSDYNIVKTTAFKRDPIKELAAACKKHGLKLGIYYSLGRDWEDPDVPTDWPTKGGRSNTWDFPDEDSKDFSKYFERKVKPQVKELLTQYGPIAVMWFDTPEGHITKAQSTELRQMIKTLQPDCIINNRIGNNVGDYNVYEQKIAVKRDALPWESCITMSGKWSYNRHDKAWKSSELMIRQLTEIVSKGGNLLLNVSPNGEGALLTESKERLDDIGKWMKVNQEAVYGTHPWIVNSESISFEKTAEAQDKAGKNTMQDTDNDNTSKEIHPDICYTAKNNVVYLFARSWKSEDLIANSFAGSKFTVKKVDLLGSSKSIKWMQDEQGLRINMPDKLPETVPVYVFKLTMN
ncbi:alpha-L-fucosidase [Desertivirga xinjiangensis]|uniref:alpha-L-fucosidase n=1 Tax=Desertivirga xinjiangensis TaxID=539206 RepID=UPI00210E73C4|nr:alpha-L-fucosidase [Pedobacter xinjiangensis]